MTRYFECEKNEHGEWIPTDREIKPPLSADATLEGACRLAIDLGYATGHADDYEALLEHVREQRNEALENQEHVADQRAQHLMEQRDEEIAQLRARVDCVSRALRHAAATPPQIMRAPELEAWALTLEGKTVAWAAREPER